MRFFHIKLADINDYEWARENPDYKERYKESIEKADKEIAAREEVVNRLRLGDEPMIVNATQIVELAMSGTEYKVLRELRPGVDDPYEPNDFLQKFQAVADKLLAAPLNEGATHSAYNARCEVHMPGQALSTYNELMLKSDVCTDALQDAIDQGWRIIAACPQPDQRRPDYILGRYNPKRDVNTGAQR